MKNRFIWTRIVSVVISVLMLSFLFALAGEPVNANVVLASSGNETDRQEAGINPFAESDREYSEVIKYSVARGQDVLSEAGKKPLSAENEVSNRYNMKFKPDCSFEQIFDLVNDFDFSIIGKSEHRLVSIESTEGFDKIKSIFDEYCVFVEKDVARTECDLFLGGEEDREVSSSKTETGISELAMPNDEYIGYQWYLDFLDMEAAWNYTTGSEAVFVAVIDSGVDRSHPDLMDADIRNGYDFSADDAVYGDYSGHGTAVTGVIAATMNNGIGITGLSPDVVIIPYCVEDSYGNISSYDTATAIYLAADLGCKVINLSLGGGSSSLEEEAVLYAYDQGCIIVAAAGNNGDGTYIYPAAYDVVISVGSVDEDYLRSDFSNCNNRLDVMAPGEYILTTDYDAASGYAFYDGTSFSSPCVAAIAALAASYDPNITPSGFEDLLIGTSVDLGIAGYDINYGYGLVNAYSIMQMISQPRASYQTHVQDIGWQDYVTIGAVSGTSGESKRLEAIHIRLEGAIGGIEYRTHVQDIGWQDWVANDALSGTSGQAKRLEAIQIRLTGEVANSYDVYYRVHAQNVGWMGWAKNGESAGTAGYSYRLEAIQIELVAKGGAAPGTTVNAYIERGATPVDGKVSYHTHVQDIGWQAYVSNGEVAGTSGQSKRLEGIQIKLENVAGGIEYSTHVQDIGWMSFVANDAMSGTSGQSKRLEAIKIHLTGAAADAYDVYYCLHAQNVGWLDWAKNGESAGTAGFSYRLEAIKIVLVPKGGAAPGPTARAFVQG
ncbi:MAG: S8 family serine peptidase [Oscillospiraceae bacterium]|nr:S8 family serine peptidase [Oscillospiraceae bacterium]